MLGVLRKSAPMFITHLMTFSMMGIAPLVLGKGEMLFMMGMLIPVWVSSSILWSEREESDELMRTLPVTSREIVGTKFLLVLATVAVYWTILLFIAAQNGTATVHFVPNVTLAGVSCLGSLLLGALWYIGRWLFGRAAMTGIILMFVILGVASTIMYAMVHDRGGFHGARDMRFIAYLAGVPWFVLAGVAVLVLLAYYGLMHVAVRARELDRVDA